MNNEINIKARKISEIETLDPNGFSFINKGEDSYLLISYNPPNGISRNYKISVNTIIDKLNEDVTNVLSSDLVLRWAQTHGFSGDESDLWELFQNGGGGSITPIGPTGETEPTGPTGEPETISVTGVSISGSTSNITVGGARTFSAVITPSNATNKNVTWTSSNNNIATVNNNGKVTAVTAGNVTITVTTEDGNYSKSINLTITAATPADTTKYLFSYASELQEGIFNKDANDNIVSVNITAIKALSYTQETNGTIPTTNKNGHGFCLQDYTTTYAESYVWDDAVENGRVWIILPAKFYNVSQKNFIDEKNGKWKFIDSMMKNPVNPALTPITISNLYEGQDYILICFSEEGHVDEQFFKKIG